MRNTITILFLLVLSSFTLQAQTTTKTKKDKKKTQKPIDKIIKFKTLVHDFGQIPEGGKVSYDFTYKNIGRKPLILEHVRASCGCTVPVWSKKPLKRRKKDKITVTYNTKGRPGAFNKKITVRTNQGTQYLLIKGVVNRPPKK